MIYLRDNNGVFEASLDGQTWEPVALGTGGGGGGGFERHFMLDELVPTVETINNKLLWCVMPNLNLPASPADPDYASFWVYNPSDALFSIHLNGTDVVRLSGVTGDDGQGIKIEHAGSCYIMGAGGSWDVISMTGTWSFII